jgi:acyl carrier protein
MTHDEVKAKVYDIIVNKMGVSKDQIKDDAKFQDDLGADSLDTVELVMEFENQFQIQIPDEDAEKISTVKTAIDYIVAKKA